MPQKHMKTLSKQHLKEDGCVSLRGEDNRLLFNVQQKILQQRYFKCFCQVLIDIIISNMEEKSQEEKEPTTDMKVSYDNGQQTFYGEFRYDIDAKAINLFRLNNFNYIDASVKEVIGQGHHCQSISLKSEGNPHHNTCHAHRTWLVLRPTNIVIGNPDVKLEGLAEQIYINNFNHNMEVKPLLKSEVQTSFESSWSQQTTLGVSEEISVGVQIKMFNLGANITATQQTTTGKSESFTKKLSIVNEAAASTTLFPGEKCKAILMIYLGHAQATITYQASLEGSFCVAYPQYKATDKGGPGNYTEHIFIEWSDPRLKFEKKKTYTQTLKIGSYSNDTIVIEPYPKP